MFLSSADDVLKLHFMKHTKVVTMETAEKVPLSVPLSSYLKFSILYDPSDSLEEARHGFKSVSGHGEWGNGVGVQHMGVD